MSDKLQVTAEELRIAGIDLDTWNDPESWGDKENAFFWEREYRALSKSDIAARTILSTMLDVPASWKHIIKAVSDKEGA